MRRGSYAARVTDTGNLLVAAQGACLAGLAWPGRPRWSLPRAVTAGAAGLTAVGATVLAEGARELGSALRAHPAPAQAAVLRTDGVFGVVRHPLYAGVLAGATGVAVLRRRPEPLLALAALSAVLHVKAGYEEGLLRERFGSAYDDYAARVPRLLPVPGLR